MFVFGGEKKKDSLGILLPWQTFCSQSRSGRTTGILKPLICNFIFFFSSPFHLWKIRCYKSMMFYAKQKIIKQTFEVHFYILEHQTTGAQKQHESYYLWEKKQTVTESKETLTLLLLCMKTFVWKSLCVCVCLFVGGRFLPHPLLPAVVAALPVEPVLPESPERSHYLGAHWVHRRCSTCSTGQRARRRGSGLRHENLLHTLLPRKLFFFKCKLPLICLQ